MENPFIFCILLSFFHARAYKTPIISNPDLDEEIMRINGEMRYMADPFGALTYNLANEILNNKKANEIIGQLKVEIARQEDLMKKIGVASYIRNKIEMYELILQNFPESAILRNLKSEPPDLDTLDINLSDTTVKNTYYLHYNRWINILEHSLDPRIGTLREEVIKLFNTYPIFSRYIAQLFIHVSNIRVNHNIPPDVLMWKNEDDVVQALHKWHINDALELTACRIVYRIPRMQSALPTNVGEKSLSTTSDGITPSILKDLGAGNSQ